MPLADLIYADQLYGHGYGHPLWHPEPNSTGEVQIGDVGYIFEGAFVRLFNILLPPDDAENKRNGVPEGFVQLHVDRAKLLRTNQRFIEPGPICANSLKKMGMTTELTAQPTGCALPSS